MPLPLEDIQSASSEQLLNLVKRRHPDYASKIEHWEFLDLSYRGGREWIEKNIFSYHKEGKREFRDRKKRAYRFPHSREVVSLVNKYVFKGSIERSDDVPAEVRGFWKSATLLKRPIQDLMDAVSAQSSTFGRIWVVVDNNVPPEVRTEADRKKFGGRTYAYILKPMQVYDFEYDQDGELEWFMCGEFVRDMSSPLSSQGKVEQLYRIWAKDYTLQIKVDGRGQNQRAGIVPNSIRQHGLGIVPVFPADNITVEELYSAPALIEDVAYLDRAVANYLSNLDVIIQDQTFSQLAIPFQGLLQSGVNTVDDTDDEDATQMDQMLQMGTRRIFAYNAEGGAAPEFISPDVKQADLIMRTITKIIGEIYHSIGMAGERTKEDNATGIDNSSGVAKAYDFERLNSMLAAKARSLETIERNLIRLVNAWGGKVAELEETESYVTYPDTFDVRSLADEMDNAQRLALIAAPKGLRRLQMKRLVGKMFPQTSNQTILDIEEEIDEDWLEVDEDVIHPSASNFPKSSRVPGKNGSQGENNKGSVKAEDKETPGD